MGYNADMTFIASVIAKDGVALIADSLVTTTKPVMEFADLYQYLKDKEDKNGQNGQTIEISELVTLFQSRPSHTKDYEEKLFQYDDYIGITTAGSAQINGERISSVIERISKELTIIKGYNNKKVETKVKDFCLELEKVVKEHLSNNENIGITTFIFTYYEWKKRQTHLFRIKVNPANKKDLQNANFKFVEHTKCYDIENVVCDGQNGISERILYGDFFKVIGITRTVVERMEKEHTLKLTDEYKDKLIKETIPDVERDLKIAKLRGLSLQQAVDLAYLLMKIEMDFQKYTEDVPTVGGVIRLAIIDKEGFRFITGKDIMDPRDHL